MIARRTLLASLGLAALTPALHQARASQEEAAATVSGGQLVELDPVASGHAAPRRTSVWLPPGYAGSDDRYPVIYMHDGQHLFDPIRERSAGLGEWGVDEHLIRLGETGQVRLPIVVGIWKTPLRLREYLPSAVADALPPETRDDLYRAYEGPPLSDGYLRFIVEDLKPQIDRMFRTASGPADTMIAGASMGGLISLYGLMRHPDVFGGAACLSSHLPLRLTGFDDPEPTWRDQVASAWSQVLRQSLSTRSNHRLYMDHGDQGRDQFYAFFQSRIDSVIRDAGWGPDRFKTLVFPTAEHNEKSWNSRLDVPLTFLLPPPESDRHA